MNWIIDYIYCSLICSLGILLIVFCLISNKAYLIGKREINIAFGVVLLLRTKNHIKPSRNLLRHVLALQCLPLNLNKQMTRLLSPGRQLYFIHAFHVVRHTEVGQVAASI